ncbi:hypothetical protein DERP_007134 [Dermatophagoides pteronyssinus]|uniref:Uncharacterized protein n=1 Tax=Dermatophagoides pteronyssinus TaxID=6956 RepID=A0ABQ8JUE0_DERPT|nr:hypothetical protein DERP_007134 [Dermatophagoides pteronyssinus]
MVDLESNINISLDNSALSNYMENKKIIYHNMIINRGYNRAKQTKQKKLEIYYITVTAATT